MKKKQQKLKETKQKPEQKKVVKKPYMKSSC